MVCGGWGLVNKHLEIITTIINDLVGDLRAQNHIQSASSARQMPFNAFIIAEVSHHFNDD